ncbi:hypothetical protein [Bosea thiooxidans]
MGDAAMRKLNLILPAVLLAGSSFLAPVAPAQNPPTSPSLQRRAPGVPAAPSPTEIERRKAEREGAAKPGERGPDGRAQAPPPSPERDPPMPRPVPSIIAP